MCSANLLGNNIGVEQAQELVKIKEEKPGLRTLCGFTMEETEVDLSGRRLRAGDAILLASDIPDMGSMSKLTFSGGSEGEYGNWEVGQAVTIDTTMTEADFSGKELGVSGATIVSAFIPKWYMRFRVLLSSLASPSSYFWDTRDTWDSGSLSSLDISKNELRAKGVKFIAEVLPKW